MVVFGSMTFGINQARLSQAIFSDGPRGRVNASLRVAGGAAGTVGLLAGWLVGTAIGLRPLFLIAGPCTALGGLVLICSPVWRIRSLGPERADRLPAPSQAAEGTAPNTSATGT